MALKASFSRFFLHLLKAVWIFSENSSVLVPPLGPVNDVLIMKDCQTEMTASVQYSDLENEHHLFGAILIKFEGRTFL